MIPLSMRQKTVTFTDPDKVTWTFAIKTGESELQVTKDTPPTLLIQSADDHLVDVDNSIRFFESLRHAGVPVDMTIFNKGEHALILIPKDRWQSIVIDWIERNGWLNQKGE